MKVESVKVNARRDYKEQKSRTRIYFWVKNEDVVMNMLKRTSRPSKLYREHLKEVLVQAWPSLFPYTDIKNMAAVLKKIVWSQRAGCSCPCSPGFIINGGWSYGKDVHVEISGKDADMVYDPASEAVIENRAAQLKADPTLAPILFKDQPRYFGEEA